jgi:hypothetical protein
VYNIHKIFYIIAVCKPDAANTVRAPDDERYTAPNMLKRAFNERWNNKFYYKVASFGYFY